MMKKNTLCFIFVLTVGYSFNVSAQTVPVSKTIPTEKTVYEVPKPKDLNDTKTKGISPYSPSSRAKAAASSASTSTASSTPQSTSVVPADSTVTAEPAIATDPSAVTDSAAKDASPSATSSTKPAAKTASTLAATAAAATGGTSTNQIPTLNSLSVSVQPFTGGASMPIPINVPAGRAGIQPSVALVYSSGLPESFTGVGWNLDLGSIQRSTKKGPPKYNSIDTFVLMQSGSSSNLVYDSTAAMYRQEIEGSFAKIVSSGTGSSMTWTMTDKKGTKYYFGQSAVSQQADPADATKIFEWSLGRVEDINGNYMTITYLKHGNELYPDTILYTGSTPLSIAPFAKVVFSYTDVTRTLTSYKTSFLVSSSKLLDNVSVYANNVLLTKYKMNYQQSVSSKRYLLSNVIQYGSDGVSALPTVSFTYQGDVKGFVDPPEKDWSVPIDGSFVYQDTVSARWQDRGVRVTDVNGDAYPDLVRGYTSCNDTQSNATYLNTKQKGFALSTPWTYPSSVKGFIRNCPSVDYANGIQFADVDGDMWPDLIRNYKRDPSYGNLFYVQTLLNDKIGSFPETAAWFPPTSAAVIFQLGLPANEYSEYEGVVYADVNGDSYTDIVISKFNGVRNNNVYINQAVNGGIGWALDPAWTTPVSAYSDFTQGATLADLNGDGLPDLVYIDGGSGKIYMNNGHGWVDAPTPWDILPYPTARFPLGVAQFADVNGDGLADIMVGDGNYIEVIINTGSGWFDDHAAWSAPSGYFARLDQRVLDANADGVVDYMYSLYGYTTEMYMNKSKPADLLVKISNGLGATTDITYESSAHYTNTFLPFIVQVVKSVKVSTATENYTTNYTYANGLWAADGREFRGFGQVKVTDPDGNYAVTNYLQDKIYKGMVSSQESYNAAGVLFGKSVNTWDFKILITGNVSVFPYLKRADSYLYDGVASDRRTAQEFFYDETTQYGNLTKSIEYGEVNLTTGVDSGNDKRTTESTYLNSSSLWLLGLPKQVTIKSNGGSQVRQTSFYYDNHPNLTDAPTKGQLTKRVRWGGTGAPTPTDFYSYDAVGNLLSTSDPKGNVTTITYDPLKLFPLTTTNALGHVATTEYYGINGVSLNNGAGLLGLWGQVKSVKDANNQIAYRVYDTFGRMIKSISPLDSVTYPTTSVDYLYTSTFLSVTSHARKTSGAAATIDGVEYYDGLGRLIQSKAKTVTAGQYIIGGQTQYNSRGLPQYKYVPRFTANALTVMDPIDTAQPKVTITYDATGRVLRTTNPNGTYSNTVYDGWKTSQYEERGARNDYTYDAYGRVVKVQEYGGYDGRSPTLYPAVTHFVHSTTNYTYDSEGNLKSVIDTQNNTATISYDNLGRKTSMSDPDMGAWSYTYDLNGNLLTQTDAKGQVITFTYDALNRLKTKTSGTTLNVTYTYDDTVNSGFAKGRLSKVDYTGGSTRFVYDLLGREIQSVKTIDGQNYTVSRVYDNLNNVTKITYPDLSTVFYQYNSVGQLQVVSNDLAVMPPLVMNQTPNAKSPTMFAWLKEKIGATFNIASLQAEQSEANSSSVIARNDPRDDEAGVTKQSDGVVKWLRANTALAMTSFASKAKFLIVKFYTAWIEPYVFGIATAEAAAPPTLFVKQIDYNANGQAMRVEYGNGIVTTQTYEALTFRLKRINTVKGATVLQDLNYTYDAIGNIRTITDAKNTATQTFSYDHRNRLLQGVEPSGYGTLNYTYASAIGNIGTKEGITYTYSKVNAGPHAVTSLSDGTAISYDVNGNMTAMIKTGDSKAFSYDVENRLIDVIKNSATLAQYFYDGDGGRVRKVNYSTTQAGNNTCFLAGTKILLADGTSKLIEEIKVGDMVASYDEKKMVKTSAKATAMFDGESAKEYLLINDSLKVTPNHMFYSQGEWKAIGKMTEGDLLLDDNLKEVTIDKIEKIKSQNPVQVYNLEVEGEHNYYANGILVHNKLSYGSLSGGVSVTSGVVTNYVGSLYEETSAVGVNSVFLGSAKIATVSNNQVRFYFQDHLGSTNVVTDSVGNSIELIEYKPFGEFARHEKYGGTENTAWYYFTGKPLDDETGLMFYGARYYSPLIGRFITPDTIVQSPMNPQTLNRYTYCNNNPVNLVDPTGHSWKNFWKAAVTAIVGTVLIIASGGTLAPVIGTYWAGVATGAMVGATIGGTFAAATGGNIGMGILTGAVGGGVFAGIGPLAQGAFRGLATGGIGPMTSGSLYVAENFTAGFLGGAASGAAVAGVNGADVGQGALMGGAAAGGFSLLSDTAYSLRRKEIQNSKLDPLGRNSSGKSSGIRGDNFKLAGARYNRNNPGAWPAPFGGNQGGQGKIFGFNYPSNGITSHVLESWAGPHDWLNGWTYDSVGNLKNLNLLEQGINTITNPLNIAIAAPLAVPLAMEPIGYSAPTIIYGESHINER